MKAIQASDRKKEELNGHWSQIRFKTRQTNAYAEPARSERPQFFFGTFVFGLEKIKGVFGTEDKCKNYGVRKTHKTSLN